MKKKTNKEGQKAPRPEGHDYWNMAGKKAGSHTPKSQKRGSDKLRKEINDARN